MKSSLIFGFAASLYLAANPVNAQSLTSDTVVMGPSYANSVYYNVITGEKSSAAMNSWHMAHTTVTRDNCIRINHAAGIEVYAYPNGDNAQFATMDTTGWHSWKKFYNDVHVHEMGALNQQPNAGNMWDFSWGVYDPNTKEVTGDSLYLFVQLTGGKPSQFYKFMPIKQLVNGNLIFRLATLDGTQDITDTLVTADFPNKSYKYYNFLNGEVNPEPNRDNWDLLFTRYYAPTPAPGGGTVMYLSMGVESKRGTRVSKILPGSWTDINDFLTANGGGLHLNYIDSAYRFPTSTVGFNKDLTRIGSDWKSFNNTTGQWTVNSQNMYLVEVNPRNGNDTEFVYLSFSEFGGSASGRIVLNRYVVPRIPGAVSKSSKALNVSLFPNPANDFVVLQFGKNLGNATVRLFSNTGAQVAQTQVSATENTGTQLPINHLTTGIYRLTVETAMGSQSFTFVKQ